MNRPQRFDNEQAMRLQSGVCNDGAIKLQRLPVAADYSVRNADISGAAPGPTQGSASMSVPVNTAVIDELVRAREAAWIETRRDLHRHPELGFTELRTAARVAQRLSELGFEVRVGSEVMDSAAMRGVPPQAELEARASALRGDNAAACWIERMPAGQTGVVAELTRGEGPVSAYRFDMDALPICEAGEQGHKPSDEGYVSTHHGIHHACGHDGHTAIGLGFAEWLASADAPWCGTVKLVFQPAEEGGRGALPMAQAGVVDDADWFFAAHLGCGLPSGEVAAASSGMLNSSKLDVVYRGTPAHAGANPEDGRNALLAGATATLNLHAISRVSSGATRVNVGRVVAGTARNIIADHCHMELEVRGESQAAADYMENRARAVLKAAADMHEVTCSISVVGQTVSPLQDEDACQLVMDVAGVTPGVASVHREFRVTGGEDAPFLMRRVQANGGKACYFIIGADLTDFHHTAHFDFDEGSLALGVRLFAGLAQTVSASR
jgi:aminobenzoyl-glutamate utilization protein A